MENNGSINKPVGWKKTPTQLTSVNIDADLWSDAKRQSIGLKDAMEFGIRFMLAELDGGFEHEYPKCQLQEKLHRIVKNFQAKAQECEALRDQMEGKIDPSIEKELNEVFENGKDEQ